MRDSFHCSDCNYDMCPECVEIFGLDHHEHPLKLIQSCSTADLWAVHNSGKKTLEEALAKRQ